MIFSQLDRAADGARLDFSDAGRGIRADFHPTTGQTLLRTRSQPHPCATCRYTSDHLLVFSSASDRYAMLICAAEGGVVRGYVCKSVDIDFLTAYSQLLEFGLF